MNGTYVWRAQGGEQYDWKPTGHDTYRCVENPRISISFMGPSKYGVQVSLLKKMDEAEAAELRAANEFSGWVAQWSEVRGLRHGYLRSNDAGAKHPTEAAFGSWQVVVADGEAPMSSDQWDVWEKNEKCVAFRGESISVTPASEEEVAAALQRRREHNARVAAVLAKPAPVVLIGGELIGCGQQIWYPSVVSDAREQDSWDWQDHWAAEEQEEERREAREEAREAREKRARAEHAAAQRARRELLHELAVQWQPATSAGEGEAKGGGGAAASVPLGCAELGDSGAQGGVRVACSAWASGIEALLGQVRPGAAMDHSCIALIRELATSAIAAIVAAATRSPAQPEARGAKLPAFIDSTFLTKVEYEAWAEEIKVVDQATDEGMGGDRGCEHIARYAQKEGRRSSAAKELVLYVNATVDLLAKAPPALRTTAATRYLTGVAEYLASELLELAGNAARDRRDEASRRRRDVDYGEHELLLAREVRP